MTKGGKKRASAKAKPERELVNLVFSEATAVWQELFQRVAKQCLTGDGMAKERDQNQVRPADAVP